jgi:cell division septal protein FtsQ
VTLTPLRERRRRAARQFLVRVCALLLLIGAIVYSAWFAPWARPVRQIPIETAR